MTNLARQLLVLPVHFRNFILAVFGGVVLRLTGNIDSTIWITWWWLFIVINIGFFVFNLIPIPPLDGSRVLYAFAPGFFQKLW